MELFDYLRLNVTDRAIHKSSRNITLKEIFDRSYNDGLARIPDSEMLSYSQISSLLGVVEPVAKRYASKGFFGDSTVEGFGRKFYSRDKVLEFFKGRCNRISRRQFQDVLGDYHLSQETFDNLYGGYSDPMVGFSASASARVFKELRKRKRIIEEWKTFKDLSLALGGQPSPHNLFRHYRGQIEEGVIPTVKSVKFLEHRIPPEHYDRMLREQKSRLSKLSVREISDVSGLCPTTVRNGIVRLRESGVLVPRDGFNGGYLLTPRLALLVVNNRGVANYQGNGDHSDGSMLKLWGAYKTTGDPVFRNPLLTRHLPLVDSIVKGLVKKLPSFIDPDELRSLGTFGLLDALDRFDLSKGVKFESYAYARVKGAIIDGLRDQDWVPIGARRCGNAYSRRVSDLEGKLGRMAWDFEIREVFPELSDSEFDHIRLGHKPVGVVQESQLSREFNLSMDKLPDGGVADPSEQLSSSDDFNWILAGLDDKERAVMTSYYRDGLNLKETGAVLGLTDSRISQINLKVLKVLRRKGRLRGLLNAG